MLSSLVLRPPCSCTKFENPKSESRNSKQIRKGESGQTGGKSDAEMRKRKAKLEIRNPRFGPVFFHFRIFCSFEFVSDFDIRISNFATTPGCRRRRSATCALDCPPPGGKGNQPEQVQPGEVVREGFHILEEEIRPGELRRDFIVALRRVRNLRRARCHARSPTHPSPRSTQSRIHRRRARN